MDLHTHESGEIIVTQGGVEGCWPQKAFSHPDLKEWMDWVHMVAYHSGTQRSEERGWQRTAMARPRLAPRLVSSTVARKVANPSGKL